MAKLLPKINTMTLDKSFVSISKAAKFLQVSPDTLRNWERAGKLLPSRTYGGARRYSAAELLKLKKEIRPFTVCRKGVLTISQASKALKISPDTLRNWDKKGLVESTRSKGGARRFTREEIRRLQKELGIESDLQPVVKVPIGIPNSSQRIHNFGSFWLKITYSLIIIMLISASGWFLNSYIEPLEKKIDETSKLVARMIGSVESLQKGVLGIQAQTTPGPLYLPGNLHTDFANTNNNESTIFSVKAPITLNSVNGEISCVSCLTDFPDYISSVTSSDDALSISTTDKQTAVSLNLGHSNTWSAAQTFNGGFYASATGDNYAAIFQSGNVGIGWTSPINKLEVAGGQTIGSGYAGAYKAPTNGLLVQGNVGIGVTAPSYTLDVGGGARFACGNKNWDSGPATDCSDIAEVYQSDGSVGVGEIVTISQQANIVTKSVSPYQKGIIGVYSTSPALLVGGQVILGSKGDLTDNEQVLSSGKEIPVALAGRVPVKVSDENGPIEIGDYLTSSSIPGVAMKATRVGPVIGQALEPFDATLWDVESPDPEQKHLVDIKLKFKNVLIFVNVSYADPGNFFASLTIDDQGNLIIPRIRANSIILDPDNTTYDLTSKIASLGDRIENAELKIKDLEAQINNRTQSNIGNVGIGVTINSASPAPSAVPQASSSAILADLLTQRSADTLDLTPPDILLATASADLVDLSVKGTLSSDKLFTAQDIKTSGNLDVFGKTTLASTYIAGDLIVDGTLSINGNSINVIGSPKCLAGSLDCGILYIQNSPLAYQVDFFNGLVTIDKFGNFKAQIVTVAEFRVVAGKISGSGKITAGSKSVDTDNPLVKSSSRILITPTQETNLVLAVTDKAEGKKFTVSTAQTAVKDIIFDWFLVNESP